MAWSSNSTFSKPKSKRQVSTKWVDLQPRERKAPGLRKVGKKGEFWIFVGLVINRFFAKIALEDRCEISLEVCDGYHKAWAHSRRRQDIRVLDWYYALRVVRACQECHFEVDAKGRREAEPIIEGIIVDRFTRMGLSEQDVKRLFLECAKAIQAEHAPKFDIYEVEL